MDPANYSIMPADPEGDRANVESPAIPPGAVPLTDGTGLRADGMPNPCDREAYLRWYYDRPGGYSGD